MNLKNQFDALRYYVNFHQLVKTILICETWEIEGNLKPGIEYPLMVFVPVSSLPIEGVMQRTYRVLVMDQLRKDKLNEEDVMNDCEKILSVFITNLKEDGIHLGHYEDIGLVGDPLLEPFKEEFGDWCAGYQGEIVLEAPMDNNPCITLTTGV
jgi:hypothetical protein